MPSTQILSASRVAELLGQIGPLFRGETEAKVGPPRKEHQVLATAGAAVFEASLADNGLAAGLLGDFGQAPEDLWANCYGSINGNNSTFCFTFSYQGA